MARRSNAPDLLTPLVRYGRGWGKLGKRSGALGSARPKNPELLPPRVGVKSIADGNTARERNDRREYACDSSHRARAHYRFALVSHRAAEHPSAPRLYLRRD